jgi:hypothetical protein
MVSLEYAQLLTESKDLEAEVAARTEEGTKAGGEIRQKCNHGSGFVSHSSDAASALTA